MRKLVFLLILAGSLILNNIQCQGNSKKGMEVGSPEWLVNRYFISDSFPSHRDYICGGPLADMPPMGESFNEGVEVSYRSLRRDSAIAVYAVTAEMVEDTLDMYCFIRKHNDKWKIDYIYSLALTGIIQMAVDSLEVIPEVPDSLKFVYENAKLVVSSDKYLKEYLRKNITRFEEIKEIFDNDTSLTSISYLGNDESTRKLLEKSMSESKDSLLKSILQQRLDEIYSMMESETASKVLVLIDQLRINSVRRASDSMIFFSIGGMVDNEVGYMYISEGVSPPVIDADPYIYLEEILPNWYIFKTT